MFPALLVAAALPLALAAAEGAPVPCHDMVTDANGGRTLIYRGDRICRDFEAPVAVSGLWVDEFEGQRLIPGHDKLDDAWRIRKDRDARNIWFSTDEQTAWPTQHVTRTGTGGVYRVRVKGRHARKKDGPVMGRGFGHMGGSDAMFLADQILSVEYLGPIAPQLR